MNQKICRLPLVLVLLSALVVCAGCATQDARRHANQDFAVLRDAYFFQYLKFNPVVSTYLGGDGYSSDLKTINGRLRDFSPQGLATELAYYQGVEKELAGIDTARLSAASLVDYRVMRSQVTFLIREIGELKLHQTATESYVIEAVNGVLGQLQQLSALDGGLCGTEEEWTLIVKRTQAIPAYLSAAEKNLLAGLANGVRPDWRKIERDGVNGCPAAARFFTNDLPGYAEKFVGNRAFAARLHRELDAADAQAAKAYDDFSAFLQATYGREDKTDRFAIGEQEYLARIRNNFGITEPLDELYAYGERQVATLESRLFATAQGLSTKYALDLPFSTDTERRASTRAVLTFLTRDAPSNDEALMGLYRKTTAAAVAFGRAQNLFAIPEDYKIDVVETPEVLRSGLFAAYVPAPPFKKGAVGQFYVTPTGNAAALAAAGPSAITAVAVHEGFPGHDWHYRFMSKHAAEISSVRWLTVGSVQDELSMWSDSMGAEAWAHYSEQLFSEAVEGGALGFYTPETYVSFLQQALWRAARVRVDIGIHTGRMSFNDAVDYFCEHVHFFPDARNQADSNEEARTVVASSDREIYRYSKWPTQAITYNLGKKAVLELRERVRTQLGAQYDQRKFHEKVMLQGTISPEFYKDLFDRLSVKSPGSCAQDAKVGQTAEWGRPRKILMHTPGDEVLMGVLHPRAALYENAFDLKTAQTEHVQYIERLRGQGAEVYRVVDVLMKGTIDAQGRAVPSPELDALREFAGTCLTYDCSGLKETEKSQQEKYKEDVLRQLSPGELVDVILQRPIVELHPTDGNTGLSAVYRSNPVMNLYFLRDQMITTAKGVVISRMNSVQRAPETEIVKFVLKKMGITPIYEVVGSGRLEGGDYFSVGEVAMIGQGLRTNPEGVKQLLDNQIFGSKFVAVVKDNWKDQEEMHLDTYFNIIGPKLAVMVEMRMKGRKTEDETKGISSKVDVYRLEKDGYRLVIADRDFQDYLEDDLGFTVIPVSRKDQNLYGINFLTVAPGRIFAIDGVSQEYKDTLKKNGVDAVWMDFGALTKGYGAAHCTTQVLLRENVLAKDASGKQD